MPSLCRQRLCKKFADLALSEEQILNGMNIFLNDTLIVLFKHYKVLSLLNNVVLIHLLHAFIPFLFPSVNSMTGGRSNAA